MELDTFYQLLLVLCSLYGTYRSLRSRSCVDSYMVDILLFLDVQIFVITIDSFCHVLAATITCFQDIFLKSLCNLCSLAQYSSTKFKDILTILVLTLLLCSGLRHIIFRSVFSLLLLFSKLIDFGLIHSSIF